MSAPQWLRRHVVSIFLIATVLCLLVGTALVTLLAEDGLDDVEVLCVGLGLLFIVLVALARVRSDNSAPKENIADQPTGPVIRSASVVPFPVRRLTQSPPTLYQTGQVIPAPIPMQSRRPPTEVDTDPRLPDLSTRVTDPDEILRTAMREDTGGYPPVGPRREEAT